MSKYEAVPETFSYYWHVRWPTGGNSEPFTEAEANIIAFALNAVSEGRCLYAMDYGHICGDYWTYTGPTDGVAP